MQAQQTKQELRLFMVKHRISGEIFKRNGIPQFFNSKRLAKHARDKAGADKYCISLGPDHRRYK